MCDGCREKEKAFVKDNFCSQCGRRSDGGVRLPYVVAIILIAIVASSTIAVSIASRKPLSMEEQARQVEEEAREQADTLLKEAKELFLSGVTLRENALAHRASVVNRVVNDSKLRYCNDEIAKFNTFRETLSEELKAKLGYLDYVGTKTK